MLRVPFADLYAVLEKTMLRLGLEPESAQLSARLFAETTRDGVYSHGLNRLPRFEAMVANGSIDVRAKPTCTASFGSIERWNGNRGVGNVNAYLVMQQTMKLARKNGIGAIGLANTNHWMRGGAFGWLAADEGMFAMCWSNTLANLPAWGASDPTVGNNPLVIAVPRANGQHVIIDMAMSQFSYGALASYAKRGEPLPDTRRIRQRRTPYDRRCSNRGLETGTSNRILEGIRAVPGSGYGCGDVVRRTGYVPASPGADPRGRSIADLPCHRSPKPGSDQ